MAAEQQRSQPRTQDETPPPREEKQSTVSLPAWRDWDRWLRVVGVAMAVVGGIVCSLPTALPLGVYVLLPLVVGGVSAVLLRSWRAILIVPVAFRVGFLLAGIPLAGAFDSLALSSSESTGEVLATLYGLQLVPVAIGIAIGIPSGKELERRLQQHATASQALN